MTLIFALLRDDHIIFASDRRHVQGWDDARYVDDDCWKTEKILGETAMLGFAGGDFGEQVIEELKANGWLERGETVSTVKDVAEKVWRVADEKLRHLDKMALPPMEFLLAGFMPDGEKSTATCFILKKDSNFYPERHSFGPARGHNNYCLIGRHRHGALYILLKCAKEMTTVEAGTRLACFTLRELGKYDNGVGGSPQVCVIRPNQKVEDKSDNLQDEMRWVDEKSEEIRRIITSLESGT
jgi:hypothetical protein